MQLVQYNELTGMESIITPYKLMVAIARKWTLVRVLSVDFAMMGISKSSMSTSERTNWRVKFVFYVVDEIV